MNNQELIKLKTWFLQIKRNLPWRRNPTSYTVWISEIMLQQTRVSTVIPYFLRWMETFPTIETVAASPLEKIIKRWEGLGYYSRARAIHKTAQILVEKYEGTFPDTVEELEKLPGIGSYTSRALLCFASHRAVAPVDGNVARVLSRFYSTPLDMTTVKGKKEIQAVADRVVMADNTPHVIGEAFMELGALVCQRIPTCTRCPIRSGCRSLQQNTLLRFPRKKSKISIRALERTVFIIAEGEWILVRKETGKKIMADLWQFPYIERRVEEKEVRDIVCKQFTMRVLSIETLAQEVQSFTRYRVSLYPIQCTVEKKHPLSSYHWVSVKNLRDFSFCSGHRRIVEKIFLTTSDKN